MKLSMFEGVALWRCPFANFLLYCPTSSGVVQLRTARGPIEPRGQVLRPRFNSRGEARPQTQSTGANVRLIKCEAHVQ